MSKAGRRSNDGTTLPIDVQKATLATAAVICDSLGETPYTRFVVSLEDFVHAYDGATRDAMLAAVKLRVSDTILANGPDELMSPKTLQRALSKNPTKINNKYMNSIHYYIYYNYSALYEKTLQQVRLEINEPLLKQFRFVLGYNEPVRSDHAARYCGRYELVRIYPYDPFTTILFGDISIGKDPMGRLQMGPFDCILRYNYSTDWKKPINRTLRGKLIVHGDRATIVLSNESHLYFLLYIDHHDNAEPGASFAGFILTDTRGTDLASVWPFYAKNIGDLDPCRTGVMEGGQLPREILKHLQRGVIHWDPAHFPGFISSKKG